MPYFGFVEGKKDIDVKEVIRVASEVLAEVIELENSEGCLGGALCLLEYDTDELLIPPTIIGQISKSKKKTCLESCKRKAYSFRSAHSLNEHFYNWHSENRGRSETVAIFDDKYIISFSGQTKQLNEVVAIITALRCGQITFGRAISLADIFQNRLILDNPKKWGL